MLIETGVRFLESLAAEALRAPAVGVLPKSVSRNPRTNRPVLSIPLPESVDHCLPDERSGTWRQFQGSFEAVPAGKWREIRFPGGIQSEAVYACNHKILNAIY